MDATVGTTPAKEVCHGRCTTAITGRGNGGSSLQIGLNVKIITFLKKIRFTVTTVVRGMIYGDSFYYYYFWSASATGSTPR